MADEPQSIGEILDTLEGLADKNERVSLGDAIHAFGNRSYGPFLVLLPLIELSPIGGIPGVPTAIAAVIILIAGQMVFGRKHLWLPGFVERRGVSSGKLCKATDTLRGLARFMDRWFHGRLPALTKGPFVRIAAVGCIVLALTVPPLELLPFASSAPMLAIAAFGLALLVRDGALMIAAIVMACAALAIGVGLWGSRNG